MQYFSDKIAFTVDRNWKSWILTWISIPCTYSLSKISDKANGNVICIN